MIPPSPTPSCVFEKNEKQPQMPAVPAREPSRSLPPSDSAQSSINAMPRSSAIALSASISAG